MTFYVDSCLITARRRVLQVAQDVITTFYLLLFRNGQSFMVILLWYVISCVGHFLIIVTMCLLELIKIYFSQCLMILDRSAEHDTSKRSEGAVVSHVWRSLCLTYCTLTVHLLLFLFVMQWPMRLSCPRPQVRPRPRTCYSHPIYKIWSL